MKTRWILLAALLLPCAPACAYIGPGAGLSVLGSLWAVLVGIALAVFAILSWPIRALWRKLRNRRPANAKAENREQV